MKEKDALAALSALAQDARLRIFRKLVGAAPAGLRPGELSDALGVPGSTLSFHLKELARAGLVTHRREGRSLVYRPALARTAELVAYLTAHCCRGDVGDAEDDDAER